MQIYLNNYCNLFIFIRVWTFIRIPTSYRLYGIYHFSKGWGLQRNWDLYTPQCLTYLCIVFWKRPWTRRFSYANG